MLVAEYLDFVARLRDLEGPDRRRAIDEAVAGTAIEAVYNRPISELSKGFRQRVGLAAAILHWPDLLVLDEPTEGLDPNQRVEIRQLISHLGRERTVILSTHVLPAKFSTPARDCLIINRGKIVADDAVDTLLTSVPTSGIRISVEVRRLRCREKNWVAFLDVHARRIARGSRGSSTIHRARSQRARCPPEYLHASPKTAAGRCTSSTERPAISRICSAS